MIEIIGFLSSTLGGKLFGMATDALAARREHKARLAEQDHIQRLADKNASKEYYAEIDKPDEDGNYSPMSHTIAFVIRLFACVYAAAILSCFFDDPGQIIYTKDPASDANKVEILFGVISFDLANNRILEMSKIGLGALLVQPVIFILCMASTGSRGKKG